MEAKYAGWCRTCGHNIEVGEDIVPDGIHWAHARCGGEESARTPYDKSKYAPKLKTDVCDKCHMTKPCDCEE